jgi:hypothetical protein
VARARRPAHVPIPQSSPAGGERGRDPQRIAEANENARSAGVHDRVQFRRGDLFKANFTPATVVTLYLLPEINARLRPQLCAS